MKWNFESTQERDDRLSRPHRWFAWRPVRLDDSGKIAWLETIWRKKQFIRILFSETSWFDYFEKEPKK
jgi:hypothetical protein